MNQNKPVVTASPRQFRCNSPKYTQLYFGEVVWLAKASHMTPPNVLSQQSQKLLQKNYSNYLSIFFSKPKKTKTNNFQCNHFLQQGNLTVHFGTTDVKNSCIYPSCSCAYFRNNSNTYG